MEINFNTVKALSSPTRVKILDQILDKESTPTQISNELDKSKSTISSHLSTLQNADLIEKDSKEGRRRVTYSPTKKAKAIIEGKEKKVKFSFGSSVFSAITGLTIGFHTLIPKFGASEVQDTAVRYEAQSLSTMTGSTGTETAKTASDIGSGIDISSFLFSSQILLVIGALFLGIAVFGFIYGWTLNKLGE
jgi:DNA-binding transcriptional ArsR family regulator